MLSFFKKPDTILNKIFFSKAHSNKNVVVDIKEDKIGIVHGTIQEAPRYLTQEEFDSDMVALPEDSDLIEWRDRLLSERKKIHG